MSSRLLEKAERRRTIPIYSKHIVPRPGAYGAWCGLKEVIKERQKEVIERLKSKAGEF
jgi:hypothetical protein